MLSGNSTIALVVARSSSQASRKSWSIQLRLAEIEWNPIYKVMPVGSSESSDLQCFGRHVTGGWDSWYRSFGFVSLFLRWHCKVPDMACLFVSLWFYAACEGVPSRGPILLTLSTGSIQIGPPRRPGSDSHRTSSY